MQKFTQPSKQDVRDWLINRRLKNAPLPDIGQIRTELGWLLTGLFAEAARIHSPVS
jgi:hypothetical protein